jgi:hypothetical protein
VYGRHPHVNEPEWEGLFQQGKGIPLMSIYLVGYDIHPSRGESYNDLINALKAYGTYWHHLDSTWLIESDKTAKQIRDELWAHMYKDDELLVIKYGEKTAAWEGFNESGQNWLRKNL